MYLAALGLALSFGFVVLFGAPYLPTKKQQVLTALDLLNLKPGQRLLELGAGDGKVTMEALRRGIDVTAIELNPILCIIIWLRSWRFRHHVTIKCGNFWHTSWGEYDAIYTFLLEKYMSRLDKKIIQENKKVMLATFAFQIPDKAPIDEKNGVYLYRY